MESDMESIEVNDGRHNLDLIAAERDQSVAHFVDPFDKSIAGIAARRALCLRDLSTGSIIAELRGAALDGYSLGFRAAGQVARDATKAMP